MFVTEIFNKYLKSSTAHNENTGICRDIEENDTVLNNLYLIKIRMFNSVSRMYDCVYD